MREHRRAAAVQRWIAEQWPRAAALLLAACALLPLAGRGAAEAPTSTAPHEWPRVWQGQTLRPLALTAVEQRFARRFPGHIGRFAADGSVWVLRDVARPTRTLHPASDCFRGLGYRIEQPWLQSEADARLSRCFVAERDGERVRVCERIVDADGQDFVDASSWFWAATLGRSSGPWRATTRVEAM
ncbi:MAG TPA: hypothetical protein VI032_16475 [Burkholderiaceae bacterium]